MGALDDAANRQRSKRNPIHTNERLRKLSVRNLCFPPKADASRMTAAAPDLVEKPHVSRVGGKKIQSSGSSMARDILISRFTKLVS